MIPYPLVEVAVTIGAETFLGEALPDTGFDGSVIVPISLASEIDLVPDLVTIRMADGHRVAVDAWEGELALADRSFAVQVRAFGDQFILGRDLLDQLEICFCYGQEVRLSFRA